jgi:hypothetical protein
MMDQTFQALLDRHAAMQAAPYRSDPERYAAEMVYLMEAMVSMLEMLRDRFDQDHRSER